MKREKLSKTAASGAVALIFLVLGFQAAIFTGNVFRHSREHRVDTVFIQAPPGSGSGQTLLSGDKESGRIAASQTCPSTDEPGASINRHQAIAEAEQGGLCDSKAGAAGFGAEPQYNSGRAGVSEANDAPRKASRSRSEASTPRVPGIIERGHASGHEYGYSDSRRAISEKFRKKPEPETFPFDPNTVSHEDLVRLGFSDRQAQVIDNYRSKGGRYYSPGDFARMYVVDSAVYARLKPFIRIAKLDLNSADSLQLTALRGIGPYYAHKILEYRRRLGGVFTSKEQLLEIDGFDADRLAGFEKGVETRPGRPRFTIWDADRSQLAAHPYIGSYAAKGILRYKSVADTADWTLSKLVENGVLNSEDAARLLYLDRSRQGYDE